jgi:DNA primase
MSTVRPGRAPETMPTRTARPWRPARDPAQLIALDLGGRTVPISHPGRVLWPETGTTKAELLDYFVAVAPVLLPYLSRRATMLWRFPEGVDSAGWFQAQCRGRPSWVPTFDVASRRGDMLHYCLIEEPATLAWLANIGTIELHPHGWTVDRPGCDGSASSRSSRRRAGWDSTWRRP